MQIRFLALLSALLFGIVGCSKEETPPPPAEDSPDAAAVEEAPVEAPAPQPTQVSDAIQQDLDSIPLVLNDGDYDGAVTTLGAMNGVAMSPQQQYAYELRLREVERVLREQAAQNEQARRAYERLGHQLMGR